MIPGDDLDDDGMAAPQDTTFRWFGPQGNLTRYFPAAFLDERTYVQTPVGAECLMCTKEITDADSGYTLPDGSTGERHPQHFACFMISIMGHSWEELLRIT